MLLFRNKAISIKLPRFIQSRVDQHYLDISLTRLIPLASLMTFGVLVGLVFNTGIDHPYDKIVHVGFFGLLTLSIHTLFCCRLRISAIVSFGLGVGGEIIQGFLPHHYASVDDAIANAIGIALVVVGIALKRSEVRQAMASDPISLNLENMGLQPVRSEVQRSSSDDETEK
ncbi:VanZ like family [Roseibium sp. TrichSKD4]|uniref:VanZ family protein n=1 Tax=Roseibium sp. TrichSKD4 TaxID=744980 RepID=UPI0001E57043|nr:VanZ family protein [Roseibium sp. TrichSKD4]EFO32303.1 VanZ like family [Roseibium sp. TrichSKD4]